MLDHQKQTRHPAVRGQGVVEYSGALIIATAIVTAGIIVVPPGFAALVNTIFSLTDTMLQGHLP